MKEDLNKYEIMVILKPDLTEEKIKTMIEKLKEVLVKEGQAEIIFEQNIGKYELAYPIKRERWGIYVVLDFLANGENIRHVEEYARLEQNILRHLLIQVDDTYKPKIDFSDYIKPISRPKEQSADRKKRALKEQSLEELIKPSPSEPTKPEKTKPLLAEKTKKETKETDEGDRLEQKIQEILEGDLKF